MAFRRPVRRFVRRPFRRGFSSRRSRFELQQVSFCREGLELGLTDCSGPDQFWFPLVSASAEYAQPLGTGGGAGLTPGAVIQKGVVVRDVNLTVELGYVPDNQATATADAIASIRCALVESQCVGIGNNTQDANVLPSNFSTNILFRNETNPNPDFQTESLSPHHKVPWRDHRYMHIPLFASTVQELSVLALAVPRELRTMFHPRARGPFQLPTGRALFLLVEIVNPYLEEQPVLAMDVVGHVKVAPMMYGNRYR